MESNTIYSILLRHRETKHGRNIILLFFTDRAKGNEFINHVCKNIFSNLDMRETLMELILQLNSQIHKGLIATINLSKLTTETIIEILEKYNAVFIFDICARESPIFMIDLEKIIGKYDKLMS